MKNIHSVLIICLILSANNFIQAQQEEPILISPYIGTTLDRVERDFFSVLPAIEGFEEAQFYLNPDNSLKAVIKLNRNGVVSDTVLERYSSPRRLEMLIVNNILKNIPIDENKIVSIKLKERNYEIKEQRIFTINDSSMFTINNSLLENKPGYLSYSFVKETRLPKIERVNIHGQGISNYILPSIGVGAGVGFLAVFTYGIISSVEINTSDKNLRDLTLAATFLYSAAGCLIGAGIGLIISPIVGLIFSEDDKSIDPNTPSGLAELEPYISFPNKISKTE